MKTIHAFGITGLFLCLLNISCSKMNDLHEVYLQQGERVYLGQPDSIAFCPGLNRIEIKCWTSDPKAGKMKIYWNNGADSIMGDISSSATDEGTIFQIEDIEAKVHLFKLMVYDKNWKNSSIPLDTLAEVYGDSYLKKLFPRRIKYAQYLTPNSVYVKLDRPTQKSVASVITYTDLSGNRVKKTVLSDANSTVLEHFKGDLNYYTAYLPLDNALDTLNSVPEHFTEFDVMMDKNLFARWSPPDIPSPTEYGGYPIEKMWDNIYDSEPYYLANGVEFTFDLGQTKKINRITQWQGWNPAVFYADQQVKSFALLGSATPDVGADLSGWTFLGSFQCTKPSGNPPYENSPEDIAHVRKGEEFKVLSDVPVRYIRYRVLELWKGTDGWFNIGELNFYTTDLN